MTATATGATAATTSRRRHSLTSNTCTNFSMAIVPRDREQGNRYRRRSRGAAGVLSVDEPKPTSSLAPTTTCTTTMPSNRNPARIRHRARTGTTAGSSTHACAVLLLFLLLAMMAPSCIVAAADLDHTSRSASSHGSPYVRLLSVTTSRRDYSSHYHHHLRGAEEEEIRLRGSSRTKPLRTHSAIVTTTAIADHSSSAEREDKRSLKQAASSSSSCQLGLDAVLSYDAANANIRADTTIANLCQADARLTELTMSSCVKCDEVLLNAQVEEEYDDGEGGTGDGDRRERQEYSECSSPVSILQNFVDLNGGSDVLLEDNTGNAATSNNNKFAFSADLTSFGGGPKAACSNRYYAVFSYEAEAVLREEDAQNLQKELNDKLEQVEYDVGVAKELADEGGGNIAASNNDNNNLVTGQSINTSAKNKKNTTNNNNKDKKPKRRFCPARLERSVCQRCQNLVKKQFEQKKCSNDLAAAREGKDCNRYFDRCRLAKFRRSCRKWRDPYANCFLPLAVSPNPDAQTCEKSCKVTLNGESTYNADSQTVQMEVTIFNNCPSVIALEKLEYSLCTECTSPDGTVEKICRDKEDILEVLREVNGGYSTMPPDALRYLVLETDKVVLEGSCLVYAKLNYEAIAAIQVFHEVFQASVEVECTDDEDPDVTATSGGVPRPIQPSESLNEAFQSYFQAEEECLYADLDGCGGRDVVYAGVDAVEESACVEVIHSPQGGVVDPNRQRELQGKPKKKSRRKVLKIRGRNRKNGQCRRKCASRNKKVRDDISAPILAAARDEEGLESEPDMRFLLSLNPPRAKCVSSDVSKPDLQKELEQRSDDIGFLPRRAAVTEVKELKCSTDSEACQDGTHKCCGTEGCSCGEQDITNENCQAGTRLADENIMECFLSLTGNVDAPNACCATSGCAGSDVC